MPSSSIATIYFDSYRTYCAVLEQAQSATDAFVLTHLDATNEALDFSRPLDEILASSGFHAMIRMLAPLQGRVRSCAFAMTMESVLAHQIPYSNTLTTDELRRLVRLEASAHLPEYDSSKFLATIYPLYGFAASPFMAMSVLVSETITSIAEHAARSINADIQRLTIAQTSAHAALRFNYPEERGVVALIGLQRGYIDISIVRNTVLLHTMTLSLEQELSETLHEAAELGYDAEKQALERTGLGKLCADALQEAASAVQANIEIAYFFGADLTKAALDEVSANPFFADAALNADATRRVKRLNPIRQLSTTLDERMKQYCARVGHILTPCIGAALPEVQSGIILSSNLPSSQRYQRKTA
jgi:Tfp pilus assembly PilM family ATPase